MEKNNYPTYIINIWSFIFNFLQKITVFDIIRRFFPKIKTGKYKYLYVEAWVVLNLFFAILSLLFVYNKDSENLSFFYSLLVFYGVLRVFEIGITQVNTLIFSDSKNEVKSYRRIIILLIHNYLEIIIWFTLSYVFFSNQFETMGNKTIIEFIYISFITMASFESPLKPLTTLGYYLVSIQTTTGLILTLISLARFIPLLNTPKSLDQEEQEITLIELKDMISELKSSNETLLDQVNRQEQRLKDIVTEKTTEQY